jgi:hypothetical protein
MYLVEIYLPVAARQQNGDIAKEMFGSVRRELTQRFGGVTAFLRAPASGLWQDPRGELQRDDIVIFEVITENLDREWWRKYRLELESRFEQESIVVHAAVIETL